MMHVPRSKMAKDYYAVYVGRVPRVYDHWPAAQAQVHRYPGASHRGFDTRAEAESSYLRWTLQHEQGREVLHSRALPHVNRSSLLQHVVDRDDETCGCAMTMQLHLFET